MKKLWFKRKTYGWGWTPATWQGWVLIALYVGLLIAISIIFHPDSSNPVFPILFLSLVVLVTIIFIGVCYKTGETPKWQWGKNTEDKQ